MVGGLSQFEAFFNQSFYYPKGLVIYWFFLLFSKNKQFKRRKIYKKYLIFQIPSSLLQYLMVEKDIKNYI